MPRSRSRINPTLEVLRLAWEKAPDLRLGQLILSTRQYDATLYDCMNELWKREDDKMVEEIIRIFGK